MFVAIDPCTGEERARRPFDDEETVDTVLDASARAARDWARRPLADRAGFLLDAAAILEDRADAWAVRMADEMGKPVAQGRAEARKCAWACRHYAQSAERYLASEAVGVEASRAWIAYRPLGPIFGIMPWNYPFWQVVRAAAPAMMAGNPFVLKHAPGVPGSSEDLVRIFAEAGLPEGVFQAIYVGTEAAGRVIGDDRVAGVTLTGSTGAGRAVAAKAGEHLKPCVLELGGSDPYVVLADADLEHAVATCVAARMQNSGQSCIAAKRFIVESPIHDAFVDGVVAAMAAQVMGDPRHDVDVGPQARHGLRDALHDQVVRSVAAGAHRVLGGEVPDGPGAFYPPTVLTGVGPGQAAFDEETFGPVACVVEAADAEAALRLANQTPYGLGAAVFTSDEERGVELAERVLEAGCCFVNDHTRSDPRLPFGGIKASGLGRELGAAGIRAFTNQKTVWVR